MNKDKYSSLKIVHVLLIVVAAAMCIVNLVSSDVSGNARVTNITGIIVFSNIIVLSVSLFYLLMGYKKNSATYYKMTMSFLVFSQTLYIVNQMSYIVTPIGESFLHIIALLIMVSIAIGKDLGKKNTSLLVLLLALCRITLFVITYIKLSSLGNASLSNLCNEICNLLFVGTVGLMVSGKYTDKQKRNTL